jgi:hypothetical protein
MKAGKEKVTPDINLHNTFHPTSGLLHEDHTGKILFKRIYKKLNVRAWNEFNRVTKIQ